MRNKINLLHGRTRTSNNTKNTQMVNWLKMLAFLEDPKKFRCQ